MRRRGRQTVAFAEDRFSPSAGFSLTCDMHSSNLPNKLSLSLARARALSLSLPPCLPPSLPPSLSLSLSLTEKERERALEPVPRESGNEFD
jgi:hypothetical protein